jgi:23S rRNA (uracil1939-C5)-methyltransferase
MKNKDLIELQIEKLTYGGEGIGKSDGIAVFVADTAPGDVVKAEIVSAKKNFAKAQLSEVITPSPHRIKPFCPLANACGGCQWQFIDYEEQLKSKKNIVEECMTKIAGIEIPVKDVLRSDEVREYRCKIQYPVQQTKNSKRFLAGYYKKGTHDIINIKYCPIQPRIIDDITDFLRKKAQEYEVTAYHEKSKKGLIRHFVFRYSHTNNNLLLTLVINMKREDYEYHTNIPAIQETTYKKQLLSDLKDLCKEVKNEFSEVTGVLVNFNASNSNLIMGRDSELITGLDFIEEEIENRKFHISADSFFQVNPVAAKKMFLEVRKTVEERANKDSKSSILDVYAGSGSFSMFVNDFAEKIVAVEESDSSVKDGEKNLELNNINNIEFKKGDAEKVLQEIEESGEKFDFVILDPPRKGCSESVINSVKKLTAKYLIYVSCNPSTLARDAKLLNEDFIPESIQPVDMFCHTYHVESILVMRKR